MSQFEFLIGHNLSLDSCDSCESSDSSDSSDISDSSDSCDSSDSSDSSDKKKVCHNFFLFYKLWQNSKIKKNWQNLITQILTKLKNWNKDNNQKLKLWQSSKI